MAGIADFIESLKTSAEPFEPYAYYGEEEDALKVYFDNTPDYARRLNSRVTIYRSIDSHELVGIQIKNVRQVLNDIGSFDVGIKHKNTNVNMLFLSAYEEFAKQEDTMKLFRELGEKVSKSGIEFCIPQVC